MIPRTIHYCWISNDPFPPLIEKCMESWKHFLPDYNIIRWDYEKVMAINSKWITQAVEAKKYAFAADYVRFYALYHHGGIYLDSDVEVLKPLDFLLALPYFIGDENTTNPFEPAIMGAEAGIPWIGQCLQYYRNRHFVDAFGNYRVQVLPAIMAKQLRKDYTLTLCDNINAFDTSPDTVCRFPYDWFCPKVYGADNVESTENTLCIHHYTSCWKQGTWVAPANTLFQKAMRAIYPIARKAKHLIKGK